MSFEITFLGASGGPVDGTTCAILVKPARVSYADIIGHGLRDTVVCVDAGSGITPLLEIVYNGLRDTPRRPRALSWYRDSLPVDEYVRTTISNPFANLPRHTNPFKFAQQILCHVGHYLITHPHLDHIAALVINSAGFSKQNPKNIYGSPHTINALQKYIFNGIIWPNMPMFNVINLKTQEFWQPFLLGPTTSTKPPPFTVTLFNLSHGELFKLKDDEVVPICYKPESTTPGPIEHYLSTAFLITATESHASLLVFGDFESDSVSKLDYNLRIWQHIAPLIVANTLSGIVLECSACNEISEKELYGHVIPNHLIGELVTLETQCKLLTDKPHPLLGLNIIINHIKEDVIGGGANSNITVYDTESELRDPRQTVLRQLDQLNQQHHLGITFSIALSGISMVL